MTECQVRQYRRHVINTSTDRSKPHEAVDRLLSEQPTLLQLNSIGVGVEVDRWVGKVTQLHPTTSRNSVALTEESVRVPEAAVATV